VVYAYSRFRKDEHKVYYYLFSDKEIRTGTSVEDFPELIHEDVWFIVDGHDPGDLPAKTIVISSPNRRLYKDFEKQNNVTTRFMPVWTWEEIDACYHTCFPSLDASTVNKLYDIWGGIPRYVLSKANDPSSLRLLESAINMVDKAECLHAIGGIEANEISHRVLHIIVTNYDSIESEDTELLEDLNDIQLNIEQDPMKVDDANSMRMYNDYQQCDTSSLSHMLTKYIHTTVAFGSNYIREQILTKFEHEKLFDLRTFLAVSEGSGPVSTLRGLLFEGYAHQVIQAGGRWTLRALDDNGEDIELSFSKLEKQLFHRREDIKNFHQGKYYIPTNKNFATVDSIIVENYLFQMTVSYNHPIKWNILQQIAHLLPQAQQTNNYICNLIFVVPPDLYGNFKKQNYLRADGKTRLRRVFHDMKYIRQYVMKIDF